MAVVVVAAAVAVVVVVIKLLLLLLLLVLWLMRLHYRWRFCSVALDPTLLHLSRNPKPLCSRSAAGLPGKTCIRALSFAHDNKSHANRIVN